MDGEKSKSNPPPTSPEEASVPAAVDATDAGAKGSMSEAALSVGNCFGCDGAATEGVAKGSTTTSAASASVDKLCDRISTAAANCKSN